MVMELCDGGSIASRLPYTEREALRATWKLLSALKYMVRHSDGAVLLPL